MVGHSAGVRELFDGVGKPSPHTGIDDQNPLEVY